MAKNTPQHPFLLTVERMLSIATKMTAKEKAELSAWEKSNLGADGKGTSDWPGWAAVAERLSH